MGSDEKATRDELNASRNVRAASKRLARHGIYLHYLKAAEQIRNENAQPVVELGELIRRAQDELVDLTGKAGGKVFGRGRPKARIIGPGETRETCTVYLDECGNHALNTNDAFKAFSLAAVIIRDRELERVDAEWKAWKLQYLGKAEKLVHEPDIRSERQSFWCGGSSKLRALAISELDEILGQLDYMAVVCVLHRPEYIAGYGMNLWTPAFPNTSTT